MAGTTQTHKTTRRGIVKSANQAGFLPKDLIPSVDGSPNFLRRSESEPFPKSGRLISVSSDISRTAPTVSGRLLGEVLDPGGKQYAFDRRIVRQFWSGSEHRTLGRLSNQAFFAEALPIFMECCLGFFMVGDRLPHSESFSLSSRQARIGAFLVVGHFPFVFGIHSKPAVRRHVRRWSASGQSSSRYKFNRSNFRAQL